MTGKLLISFNEFNNSNELDISSIPNGIYYMEMVDISSGNRSVGRIIKMN